MRWLKHDINARNDLRIKLLKKRYGLEGYGAYFSLLEIIGENINADNLEEWGYVDTLHTVETLAEECFTTPEKLTEIIKYCDEIGLFEQKNGKLFCPKILYRLDEYAEKIKAKKEKKTQSGQYPDKVETKSRIEIEDRNRNRKEERVKKIEHSLKYLINIPQEDIENFYQKYEASKLQIKQLGESLKTWCDANGRVKKNYRSFLQNRLVAQYGLKKQVQQFEPTDYPDITPEQREKNLARMAEIRKQWKK